MAFPISSLSLLSLGFEPMTFHRKLQIPNPLSYSLLSCCLHYDVKPVISNGNTWNSSGTDIVLGGALSVDFPPKRFLLTPQTGSLLCRHQGFGVLSVILANHSIKLLSSLFQDLQVEALHRVSAPRSPRRPAQAYSVNCSPCGSQTRVFISARVSSHNELLY